MEARTEQFLRECTFSPQTNEGEKSRLLERLLAGSGSSLAMTPTDGSVLSADELPDTANVADGLGLGQPDDAG